MKTWFLYILSLLLLQSNAFAQQLDEAEINTLVSGNTLTGRSVEGRFFSEYHLADGRVFGNNGYYENTDACWITKPGQICYYYGQDKNRSASCFAFEKSNDIIKMRLVFPNPKAGILDAFAKVENGDPRNHSGLDVASKKWTCDGLVSSLPHSKAAIMSIWTRLKTNSGLKPHIAIAQLAPHETASQRKTPLGAIPRLNNNPNPNSEKQLPPGQIAQPFGKPAQAFSIKAPQNSSANLPHAKTDRIPQKLMSNDINGYRQKALPIKNHPRPQPVFAMSPKSLKAQPMQRFGAAQQQNPPVHLRHAPVNGTKTSVIKTNYPVKASVSDSQLAKPFPVIQRKICAAGRSAC